MSELAQMPRIIEIETRIRTATAAALTAAVAVALALAAFDPWLAIVAAAFVIGWSQLAGP